MFKCASTLEKYEVYKKFLRGIFTGRLRYIYVNSMIQQNYYDILKVKRDCTPKDIRNAFLLLSKELHPDKNQNDPKTHQRFVKLNEAYSVLSRPNTRSEYDKSLVSPNRHIHSTYAYNPSSTQSSYAHEQYYWKTEYNRSTKDAQGKKNLSKPWIVLLCVIFTSIGVGLQVLAIRSSLTFSRDKLDQLSEENSRALAQVRKRASENGNKIQYEIIRQRIDDSVQQHNLRMKRDN